MKKTNWYPKHIKPVRKGWYEVKGCEGYFICAGMHYWDNGWYFKGVGLMPVDPLPWRGIAK